MNASPSATPSATPSAVQADAAVAAAAPLLDVRRLTTTFPVGSTLFGRARSQVHAVDDVSFTVRRGELVGLVGESGSGKTTVGRSILRLVDAASGEVRFDGVDVLALDPAAFRPYRRRMQIIFQDPFASLDPRKTVEGVIAEALIIHRLGGRGERRDRVAALLEKVGLSADAMRRYPHEFSGGQRQRIGIARALAVDPAFIVADEPVSALDVSIQAQIINLMQDLQQELGLTMLFIAHDLAVVEHACDRIVVMYLGRVMETGATADLYARPRHPYTRALLSAAPSLDLDRRRDKIILEGDIPSPIDPPSGCVFRTRCPEARPACAATRPTLTEAAPGHAVACLRADEI
jgi:oligopeptide/dipeptide ABC transporter ATP-binding protein